MVNTKMRYKFRPEWFETYGLDKRKNMLQSLICPCGCGEKATLIAETTEELTNLAASLLM
jgi:hypothetical protein